MAAKQLRRDMRISSTYSLLFTLTAGLLFAKNAQALQSQWSAEIGPAALSVQSMTVDWDNNGTSDILVTEPNRLRVFNGATGALQWELATGNPPSSALGPINILDVGLNRRAPVDVDGDGLQDLLCVYTDWREFPATNTLRLYDLTTKSLKWERPLEGSHFMFNVAKLDAGPKHSIIIRSDEPLVRVLEGTDGSVRFTRTITHDSEVKMIDWDNAGGSELLVRDGNLFTVYDANGNATWDMSVTSPAGFSPARGPYNLQRTDFNRYTLKDVNADGHPDFVLEFSASDPLAEVIVVTNIFQMYDLKNKRLKWDVNVGMRQSIAVAEFARVDRTARNAAFISSLDDNLGGYVLNVLDGVTGRQRWSRFVLQPPTLIDLENDGFADVAIQDATSLTVYDGASGKLKLQFEAPIAGSELLTLFTQETSLNNRGPVDIDADGRPDILTVQDGFLQLYSLDTGLLKSEQLLPEMSGRAWLDIGQADNDLQKELFIMGASIDADEILFPTLTVIDGK